MQFYDINTNYVEATRNRKNLNPLFLKKIKKKKEMEYGEIEWYERIGPIKGYKIT